MRSGDETMNAELVKQLREEAERLSGHSLDRGVQEAGIAANLANRAADFIESMEAKQVEPVAWLHETEWGDRDVSFEKARNPQWKSTPLYFAF
jgi:Ni,Fe-hydrogenase I small subunit